MGAKDKVKMPCIGCGLCCTKVGQYFDNYDSQMNYMKKALDQFPYQIDDNGKCEKLGSNGQCGVYKNRPLACDMEKLYSLGKKELKMTRKEYYSMLNVNGCIPLLVEAGRSQDVDELLKITFKN